MKKNRGRHGKVWKENVGSIILLLLTIWKVFLFERQKDSKSPFHTREWMRGEE